MRTVFKRHKCHGPGIWPWTVDFCSAFGSLWSKPAIVLPYLIAIIFSFSTGAANDIQTVIIAWFFAGVFGSAPITVTGGVLSDIWSPVERGTAIALYAFTVLCGAVLGPIAGGAIARSYLLWRWTHYVSHFRMPILARTDSSSSRLL